MMLSAHVVIALVSIFVTTFTALYPSKGKIAGSFILMVCALMSGLLLILSGSPVVKVCISGALYLVYTISLVLVAKKKLAYQYG